MAARNVPQSANKSPGDLITAALFNTGLYYFWDFMKGPPYFRGWGSVAINLTTGVWTPMALNTTDFDSDTGHSNVTNNSRYTCQVAGWYWVEGYVAVAAGTASRSESAVYKNGTVVPSSQFVARTNDTQSWNAQAIVQLAVGDYVEIYCRQNSGGTLTTHTGIDAVPSMNVFWIHS